MADDKQQKDPDVVRMYTSARRFPKLIGRFPDGRPVPFGPYTLPQLGGGFAALVLLYFTRPVWAHFGGILNIALAVMVTIGVIWGLGKLNQSGRSHLSRLGGLGRALSRTPSHRVDGRMLRIRGPHAVGGGVDVADTTAVRITPALDAVSAVLVEDNVSTVTVNEFPPSPAAPAVPRRMPRQRPVRDPMPTGSADQIAPPPWMQPTPQSPPSPAPVHRTEPPAHSGAQQGVPDRPRVAAAAGTGVAQLLAIAESAAHRKAN